MFIKNNYLKIAICIILICTIMWNYSIESYANPLVLAPYAIKALILFLASMGILYYITQQPGGVQGFADGFVAWLDEVKGIHDGYIMLHELGLNATMSGVKMKTRKMNKLITEYYNSIYKPQTWHMDEFSGVHNPIISTFTSFKGKAELIKDKPVLDLVYNSYEMQSVPLGNGYDLKVGMSYQNNTYITMYWGIYHFGVGTGLGGILDKTDNIKFSDSNIMNVDIRFEANQTASVIMCRVTNIFGNAKVYYEMVNFIPELVGNLGAYRIGVDAPPSPGVCPNTLALPWNLGYDGSICPDIPWTGELDVLKQIGIDAVLEHIGTMPWEILLDNIIGIPIPIIDSLPQPIIIVDEDGIVLDIEVPDVPESSPDTKEQTNILAKILAFLLSIFEFPEDVKLDFEPLKLDNLKTKFPFSIPFDFFNAINLFKANAISPPLNIKLNTSFVNVDHTIDIAFLVPFIGFFRYVTSIWFAIFLMFKTRDLIKW